MTVLKPVLLLLLMNHFVPVSCQNPNPCQRIRNGKVRHPTSCTKYYDCANYRAKQQTCKSTEHYSTKARDCVPIHQSSCVITTTPVPTTKGFPLSNQATTIRKPESGFVPESGSVAESISGSGSVIGSVHGSETGSIPKCSPSEENLNLFDKYEYSGKTYYLSKAIYTSDVASAAMCTTMCGYLAEIDDKEEHDFVVSINAKYDHWGIFVAGTDKHTEGTWVYDRTAKSVNYFNWCLEPKEPNNYNNQDCMGVSKKHSCMVDHQCVHEYVYKFRYLCEVD